MHFTAEISLGSVGIIVTIIAAVLRVGMQVGAIQSVVKNQGEAISQHTARLDKHEERLIAVVSDVQRMIGRLEATQDRLEKITGHRAGEGRH